MLLWTAVGTVSGAVVGEWIWPLDPYGRGLPGVIRGALLGFLIAVIALRVIGAHARHLDTAV
jgi:presenilin-like A22 family membrane protease